jgi:hypothetical protein
MRVRQARLLTVAALIAPLLVLLLPSPTVSSPVRPYQHAADYSWVAGRLRFNPVEGGFWTLIYEKTSGPGQSEPYGGHFVLKSAPGTTPLAGFKDGDLVCVHGRVLKDQMGIEMAGTYYEVQTAVRLPRQSDPKAPG